MIYLVKEKLHMMKMDEIFMLKPIVQNQLNQIQQNVKTKKQTHQREFTHQKMKHRQNITSRRLRPRFRQQQKHKFLQSQRSKENSGPKKTLRTSHFHDFTFLPFLIYTYINYHILYFIYLNQSRIFGFYK